MAGTPISTVPITGAFTFPIFGADGLADQIYIGPSPAGSLRVIDVRAPVTKTDAESFALLHETHMLLIESQNIVAKKIVDAQRRGDRDLVEKLRQDYVQAADFLEKAEIRFNHRVKNLNDQLPNGSYTVLMETDWEDEIQRVYEKNREFSVNMLQVFNATTRIVPDDEKLKRLNMELLQKETTQNVGGFSGRQQYTITITPYLACMMQFPEIMLGSDEPPTFTAYTSYEHNQMVNMKGSAKYSLKSVYDYFHEKTEEGGFFDTATSETIKESLVSTKTIQVSLSDEGDYPADQKAVLRDELRKFAFADAIANLSALVPEGTEPAENGASKAADELMKVCGANPYCAAASAALKVLSSVFGSSSQTETLIKTLSDEREYIFNEASTIKIPAAVIYTSVG
ncbi:MAG: hypothetical protein ACSHXB_04920 [Sulfitobacter sp.]